MASDRFRYWLNRYLLVAMLTFLLSAGFFLNSLVAVYRGDLESYFSPSSSTAPTSSGARKLTAPGAPWSS